MLNKTFNVKQEGDKKILELYLYGEILPNEKNFFGEEIKSETSVDTIREIINEVGTVDEIDVYINSPGGNVDQGIAIGNVLRQQKCLTVAYIDGFALSIASVIAASAQKTVMPSNTTMMIHEPWRALWGNAKEFRDAAEQLDIISDSMKNTYLYKAGEKLSKELLDELMDKETFLTADDAFKYGLCDEIANPIEDTNDSKEIAEQALKNPNFNDSSKRAIKQAYENMTTQRKSPPAPPANQKAAESKEPKKDFYERLKDSFNNKF
jgi:ATP-dependent Clp protease protease subunit